ncbi:MAG: hypothetical protein IH624_08980 [Phycisphaerae bacterium]|nr:hypothetical protein [Phycisphaerae bacterium]
MPAGKPSQSSAMMYTLIAFVTISIIATVCAVYFYVKAEDYKTQRNTKDETLIKHANASEQMQTAKIVGKPAQGKTILGTMDNLLNEMVSAIIGTIPEDMPATVKANDAKVKINETFEVLVNDGIVSSTEGVNLIQIVRQLKGHLDTLNENQRQLAQRYLKLQDDFDAAEAESRFKEQQLIDEKNRFQALADDVQAKFDELRRIANKSTEEQVQIYMDKLEKEQAKVKERGMELLTTQEELKNTKNSLAMALEKLEAIKGGGLDIEVAAFKPDARIVRIDDQAKVVYLDIGSKDHVFRGLTFSVYDRNAPIPDDGKGKAEIEVFQVSENVSAAKINESSKKNPIVPEDIVANLIWDSRTSNRFVVAGDFDFDGNGAIDADGDEKMIQLIERWGGRIVGEVTIETDFVLLGIKPSPLPRPTTEDIQIDPTVEQKYEASLQAGQRYEEIFSRAASLRVPVINQERFLHLIGYRSLAKKSTPF